MARGPAAEFRIVPAGDAAVVIEFEERIDPAINARAIALADAVRATSLAGVRDVVPTYRSVTVYFDPLRTPLDTLMRTLDDQAAGASAAAPPRREPIVVPVCYGGDFGPDLAALAARVGLSEDEVVARHVAVDYRVFMLGFVPGFTYMGLVDQRIAAPRHSTPRTRVPAGSVGIAGNQTGIYPAATPGGWQLIGRTPLKPFDAARPEPFLFKPGDIVRFEAVDADRFARLGAPRTGADISAPVRLQDTSGPFLRVIKAGVLTTVQDSGRWGCQAEGVPVAGPMDACSHRIANALVGNGSDAATLEVTLVGPELEFADDRLVAVAGAEFALAVDGRPVPISTAFAIRPGSRLRFGPRGRGARAYVAIEGGIDVAPVFGSRATHVVSAMGGHEGRPLKPGDVLPLGARSTRTPAVPKLSGHVPRTLPSGGTATVRVLAGPQQEFFVAGALDALQSAPYAIDTRSDRMAFRLTGPLLTHARGADTISDAAPIGSLQVPASGQPIMLMADRQTTGGYPKLATVIAADIPVAGQLGPGDRISFVVCSRREAMAALIAQEQQLMAIEGAAR